MAASKKRKLARPTAPPGSAFRRGGAYTGSSAGFAGVTFSYSSSSGSLAKLGQWAEDDALELVDGRGMSSDDVFSDPTAASVAWLAAGQRFLTTDGWQVVRRADGEISARPGAGAH